MIVGFSKHGKGRAQGVLDYLLDENRASSALNYLLGDKNRAGVRRSPLPVVVRGDPTVTGKLIDSSPFKWRYTSGVLSFSAGERITPEMEHKIMDEFETAAFAGLSRDRYDILWIRHAHTGREELHFLAPRMELATGKSLNIAPPGKASRQLFDTFRSKINAEFGLSDPDDPSRRRMLSLPSVVAKLKTQPGQSWSACSAQVRQAINDCIAAKVRGGTVANRDQVVCELKAAGFKVVRQGTDYLSVLQPITGKRFRLRGECYRKNWAGVRQHTPAIRGRDAGRAAVLARQLTRLSQTRAEFNLKRYGLPSLLHSTPLLAYDRTRNASPQLAQTVGGTIPATRPAVCQHIDRFDQAARRWGRADFDLERATIRFGEANRTFTTGFEQTLATCEQQHSGDFISRHGTLPVRSPLSGLNRGPQPDFEPEMEVEFP